MAHASLRALYLDIINVQIYLESKSHFNMWQSFLSQIIHRNHGFLSASEDDMDPFMRHLQQFQCLRPNICPISCHITLIPLNWTVSSTSSSVISVFSEKKIGLYLAKLKTPVLSMRLAYPNTQFQSSLLYISLLSTHMSAYPSFGRFR